MEAKSEGDAEAGESPPPMCDLFWKIYNSEKAEADASPRGELTLVETEVTVPAACATMKDPLMRTAARKPGGCVTVWVPCLTNKAELCRGDELWVK